MASIHKGERFATLPDAIAAVEEFATHTQLRRVRQKAAWPVSTPAASASALAGRDQESGDSGANRDDGGGAAGDAPDVVVLECENAPACKWFVRLAFSRNEKKWRISSMNTAHHRSQCHETVAPGAAGATTTSNALFASTAANGFQPTKPSELLRVSSRFPTSSSATTAAASGFETLLRTPAIQPTVAAVSVGVTFESWKDASGAVRALAHSLGRRTFTQKATQMVVDDRLATVRRIVCQNHRNSQCEWHVVLEERGNRNDSGMIEQYVVLSLHPTHSHECLETHNFSARKPIGPLATTIASNSNNNNNNNNNIIGDSNTGLGLATPSSSSLLPSSSSLVNDAHKYKLTHEMRWSSGRDATKSISDFALVVQRKRAMLCKRNNGGNNKKYVCSDEPQCLWFVLLVRGWKNKSWKISSMNLRHSEQCRGVPKPTTRQLAEMHFFRHAVATHTKSNGTLLTDTFLRESAAGIAIPRGMAYRAQRIVVATSTDDVAESYKFLPSLLDAFARKNAGATAVYDRDDSDRFVRAFVMPPAVVSHALQPVVGVEVVHYAGVNYVGALALLIGRDGNLTNHVLAFALVPSGDIEHMQWFLAHCKSGGARLDTAATAAVFCSQSESGLQRALALEARGVPVLFCVRSLVTALRRDKSVPALSAADEDFVAALQRASTADAFASSMQQLKIRNAPAAAWLSNVNPSNWASHLHGTTRLFGWSTTGSDDALAGSDVQQSDDAPFDLVYSLLAFVMDRVFQRAQLANKLQAEQPALTPNVDAAYRRAFHDATAFTVRACDALVAFAWQTGARPKITHRVELAQRTCSCGQMQQLGMPCSHFVAVAQRFGNEAALLDAFDAIYKAAAYAAAHSSLRLEIPAGDDLTKDSSLQPALLKQKKKGAKSKKRVRPSNAVTPPMSGLPFGLDDVAVSSSSGRVALHASKAPRLDFDADAVARLSDFV